MKLNEITGSMDRTYFSTYSAAVQFARQQALKQGYEVHEHDWHRHVSGGPAKPIEGNTVRLNIPLHKDDKPIDNKMLAVQVYNRGTETNPFELNYYLT